MDSFDSTDEDPDLWPPVIFIFSFLFFYPGDLYYLGYKK